MTDEVVLPMKILPTKILFTFAGANMGGQGVHICGTCGAMVLETDQPQHIGWHGTLQRLLLVKNIELTMEDIEKGRDTNDGVTGTAEAEADPGTAAQREAEG